jgi:hypothetical protein
MKSLFLIDNSSDALDVKESLLKDFRKKFLNAELSKTVKTAGRRTKEVIVPATEPLVFSGFQVQLSDLLQYVSFLTDDGSNAFAGLQTSLSNLFDAATNDANHPLNNNNKAIWIDLGYGPSGPRNDKTTNQLQLVITAVADGSTPQDRDTGVFCTATERIKRLVISTEPPISGTVKPME